MGPTQDAVCLCLRNTVCSTCLHCHLRPKLHCVHPVLFVNRLHCFRQFWMVLEVVSAFQYTSQMRKLHHSSPEIVGERRLGSIVAAYLPNELTVLIDTVKAVANTFHELPAGTTLDIVLAHNGGKKDQRIALLEDLSQED